jgi:hypothetical protein
MMAAAMSPKERIEAVLWGGRPDKVPFAPYIEMVPRGDFARELRNRGMALWTFRTRTLRSITPNCRTESVIAGNISTRIVHTPVGEVSTIVRRGLTRNAARERALLEKGLICGPADFAPVIYMLDDEQFMPDEDNYLWTKMDLGQDGHVRARADLAPPYMAAFGYFGHGANHGIERFVYAQQDNPTEFQSLLEAIERRNQRALPLVLASAADVICIGDINGHYGPRTYRDRIVPWYQEYVPQLHARGKLVYNHAHSSHLKGYLDYIPLTGLDMVDAFTPPPIGDLSVAEARRAWGNDIAIAVNFPESIFLEGRQATYDYVRRIVESDPNGRLIIGFTEMGISMVSDPQTEALFKEGMRAIMDAIDDACGCPRGGVA